MRWTLWSAVMLAGLALGLWPRAVTPRVNPTFPPPTLQAMVAALGVFLLLIWPLRVLARSARGATDTGGRLAVEGLTYLLAATPLLAIAAHLADANVTDVARSILWLLALWPLAFGAALWLRRSTPELVLMDLLLIVLGLPAAAYVAGEWMVLSPGGPAEALARLSPVLFGWRVAASRQATVLPHPVWPMLVWLAVGLAAVLIALWAPHKPSTAASRGD